MNRGEKYGGDCEARSSLPRPSAIPEGLGIIGRRAWGASGEVVAEMARRSRADHGAANERGQLVAEQVGDHRARPAKAKAMTVATISSVNPSQARVMALKVSALPPVTSPSLCAYDPAWLVDVEPRIQAACCGEGASASSRTAPRAERLLIVAPIGAGFFSLSFHREKVVG